jgi:16S rRNA (uracil1498-N3)-methyltransferase
MSAPRFFCTTPLSPALAGTVIDLPDAVAHHAVRVLRLGGGDPLTLFDGTGGEYAATLAGIDRRGTTARVDAFLPVERESPLAVTLAQAIAANDAMDAALRRATELGVASIQPLVTARSAPLPSGERGLRRVAHWRGVVIAACEQCGRNRVPDVAAPEPLADWLRAWNGGGILFMPEAPRAVAALARPAMPLALLIGPEGGFDAREIAAARAKDFHAASLGPRILRAETAAAAGASVVQSLWGDFR